MSKTILIVEDNKSHRLLFKDLLQSKGYETVECYDGVDTLMLARKHMPDLIIMDIQLPGASGIEHTKMLKADHTLQYIPVLAVTAFSVIDDNERILSAGCDGYLSKPIDATLFLETVAKFIG